MTSRRLPLLERASANPVLLAFLLVAATVLAYRPVWNAGFIWDDDDYVTANRLLTEPDGLRRIWFSLESPSQYFPLVYSVFRLEHKLWGNQPSGYHWCNLCLHVANALLALALLKRLAVPGAWLAAALFALHPVQVESVAWVSELKNLLSCLFFLLALLSWLEFTRGPNSSWRFCALALLLHALALLSKTTACILPLVLVLLLWVREQRLGWVRLFQVFPFAILSLAMGLLTIWWERHHQGTHGNLFSLSLFERLLVASHALWFYAGKLAWPANLCFSYPRWNINPANPAALAWLLATLALAAVLVAFRKRLNRRALAALLFFIIMLSPLLGFVMLYTFRYSFVADHYQYVACLGPFALFAAGSTKWLPILHRRVAWAGAVCAGVFLVGLGVLTSRQCKIFANEETLWHATIEKNPQSWLAENNLGLCLLQKDDVASAITHFHRALELNPQDMEAHENLANALLRQGDVENALSHYRKALELNSSLAEFHYNYAKALSQRGLPEEAIAEYRRAIESNPRHALANYNLANALAESGHQIEAIVCYREALKLRPDLAEAHSNLGTTLVRAGHSEEAMVEFEAALAIKPADAGVHYNLANALLQAGKPAEAIPHYQRAFELEPARAQAHLNLGTALLLAGKPGEAVAEYQAGLQASPQDAGAHYNLGMAFLQLDRRQDASIQFRKALELNPAQEAAKQQLQLLQVPSQ